MRSKDPDRILTAEDIAEAFDKVRDSDQVTTFSRAPDPSFEELFKANLRSLLDFFQWKMEGFQAEPDPVDPKVMNVRFFMYPAFVPSKNVIIPMNLLDDPPLARQAACECGARSLGYERGPGHSSWCPWSKP